MRYKQIERIPGLEGPLSAYRLTQEASAQPNIEEAPTLDLDDADL